MNYISQLALDFEENILSPNENAGNRKKSQTEALPEPVVEEVEAKVSSNDHDDEDESNMLSIIVKADTAGSLTSIQDTVDEMSGISVRTQNLLLSLDYTGLTFDVSLIATDRSHGDRQYLCSRCRCRDQQRLPNFWLQREAAPT